MPSAEKTENYILFSKNFHEIVRICRIRVYQKLYNHCSKLVTCKKLKKKTKTCNEF